MAEETELKLRLAPTDVRRLRAALRRLAGPPRRTHVLSIYYDTPELALAARGYALRIRRVGRQWVQTLKGGGAESGGLHRREEENLKVRAPRPDATALAAAGLDPASLTPVFVTDFQRESWPIAHGEARLEAALDRGVIRCGERERAFLELELELNAGPSRALYQVARLLASQIPLAPEPRSKAERGYALFEGREEAPTRATVPPLFPRQSVDAAFATLFGHTLQQITRNQPGVLASGDPEFLHQMRVGLRRLRALFTLFREAVPADTWAGWAPRLRTLAAKLGQARDWDVLAMQLLPAFEASEEMRAPHLRRAIAARRRQAHAEVQALVGGTAYGVLMLEMGEWLASRGWRKGADASRRSLLAAPVARLAGEWLEKRRRRFLRAGEKLKWGDDVKRHRLRVQAKKLRYGLEFLGTLLPEAVRKPWLRRLSRLQDRLGELNDLAEAAQVMEGWAKESRSTPRREQATRFLAWAKRQRRKALAALPRAWKEVKRCPPLGEP
jgi:triphosphatase